METGLSPALSSACLREAAVQGPVVHWHSRHCSMLVRQQDVCLTKACVDYLVAARAAAIARRVFTEHLLPGSILGAS